MVTGSTFGAAILIFIFLGWTYIGIKRKQSDSLWEVRRDELKFAEPIEVLGRGTFGIVLKAEYRGTNVAVKRLLMGDKHTQMKHEFIEEMRLLSKLRHPCITTIMGAVVDRHGEPMLVMECMEYGSLYDLLHNDTAVIEGELILPILCDIAQGIRFLHAARPMIIHGDLKAQNVLVDSSFRAKVADFGFTQKKRFGRRTKSTFGTPLWMAPELLRGGQSTPASDVYAFGILLSEVYSRKDPYEGEDIAKVLEEVANVDREVEKRPYIPPAVPKDAASLMKDCWNKHAEARPHFDEIERRLRAL
ncbi:hypothetical protein GUITHDRAFT_83074, partial [Guillardia theta CCMP2712]